MRVLVTGVTGFVGQYVIRNLLKNNHEVIATSRNQPKAETFDWYDKVEYISCDLNYPVESYYEFFGKPDLLIHLAWEGLPNYKDGFHIDRNLYQNYFFIKSMIEQGLKDVTLIGTCYEYGLKDGCLSEDMVSNPSNSYGVAKDSLRIFIQLLNEQLDFEFKWVRLFYMYGEGQNKNSMFSQLNAALENNDNTFNMSGGEQLRDFLPVEKVAECIVKIALQNKITGIINCCSGKPISVRSFVENYLKEINKYIELNLGYYPYSDCETMAFWGDNSKLLKVLND